MVSFSGHVLPIAATIAIWFFATGLVAWIDNRERGTFARSIALAGVAAVGGLALIVFSMHLETLAAIYAAFTGAILIWSWHEISFLTGAITGPRRTPCPPQSRGWTRFFHATSALIWHEIALVSTALTLILLTWSANNQVGAMVFGLMLIMRLSTKINIFFGVPNMSTEILPPHLDYLQSYFGPRRYTWMLAGSIAAVVAMAAWIGTIALNAPSGSAEAAGASLLFTLAALGALEHLFLALPFRDGALWGWALPTRRTAK
ncbi:photosynthetic complex assembly protein 2 [Novosphingobium sp. AAP83]|uniref:putative photosynthetic complex assembly protein PuhE n=1 Tax=Novosphingobium sp. AAP83 TaxID=1523425 RepID=UPI0006B9CA09|nr:putative photosynthetic complex assembly protein PuhE [Novosphingobium sp. AAP83]KPF93647.1 photosynthetic complex assembly protein 2 [Novosphingobium sp. AAP83]